jgi:hypothetical protein
MNIVYSLQKWDIVTLSFIYMIDYTYVGSVGVGGGVAGG